MVESISQINFPSSSPTQDNPPVAINISENQESLKPMIPDKFEAKQIGQEMQQLPYEATFVVAQLAKKIFHKIKQDSRLRNDLQVALDKPTTISINVDGKLAYKGIDGKQPLVNDVSKTELAYVAKALQLREGQSLDEPRHVTISINGREVFRVNQGKVELNRFSPQRAQNLSQSLKKHDLAQDKTVQPSTVVPEVSEQETIADKSHKPSISQTPSGYEVITETPTIPVTTFSSVETDNDLKRNSQKQTFQSFNQSF
ncbi:MAG: hypothetical protein HC820_06180 [Hydrococcus sp. RM1_1_31]|nr:hypothetical protein [Hydrococcus sp. RM1_1_31]